MELDVEGFIGYKLLELQRGANRKDVLSEIFKLFEEQRTQYENEIRDKEKIIAEMYRETTIDKQPHCCEFHLSMDGVCFICGNHARAL